MTPDKYTNQELLLDVGEGHQLYVHDWGNSQAKLPVMLLHGGPGNGCDNRHKKGFDPAIQRVIFHDQRGAGKSLPAGSLQHNTTSDLVADIEKIARKLGLERFILVGGSWGSTLALAYGIAHPKHVAAMLLNGIFTAAKDETGWLNRGGWRDFFPEVWQQYAASVPEAQRDDPTAYHLQQALSGDAEAAKQSAYAFETMELALLKLDDTYTPGDFDTYDPTVMRIEMHYDAQDYFLTDNEIIRNAAKLTMPIWLLQGRYDMVCRPATAYRLHQALPDSNLIWTINGHLRQHEAKNIQRLLLQQITGVI